MVSKGVVIAVDGEEVYVFVRRESACEGCHKQCASCESVGGLDESVKVRNTLGAKKGDTVEIELPSSPIILACAVLFLLPPLLTVGMYFLLEYIGAAGFMLKGIVSAFLILAYFAAYFFIGRRFIKRGFQVTMKNIL